GDLGAFAWSLGIKLEAHGVNASLADVTTAGTRVDELFSTGFAYTRPTADGEAVSAVHLSRTENRTLSPHSAQLVLKGTIRTQVPGGGQGSLTLNPVEGLRGLGQPVPLEVVGLGPVGSAAYIPETFPLNVEVLHFDPFDFFIRGDSNQDGKHDLSDSIFTLN